VKHRYTTIEVSAKTGNNIHNMFRKISEKLIEDKSTPSGKEVEGEKREKAVESSKNIALEKKGLPEESKKQCQC
jgi:hypothetical protein